MKSSTIAAGLVRPRISLMSAPAAKARSLPVMTMRADRLVGVEGQQLRAQFVHQRVAQRVQRGRTVEADQADAALGFDEDVLVGGHERVSGQIGFRALSEEAMLA